MSARLVIVLAALVCLAAAVPPVPGTVVRPFDPPDEPWLAGHRGVDLVAVPGDAVVAALPGRVTFAGEVAGSTWVTLAHGSRWHTSYGVLARLAVAAGERVEAGGLLGLVAPGSDHLHWSARRDGAYVDPLVLLGGWRIASGPETLQWAAAPDAPPGAPRYADRTGLRAELGLSRQATTSQRARGPRSVPSRVRLAAAGQRPVP